MPKMNVNLYVIEDYENETALRPKKTNPNKPNFFKGQNRLPENLATPSKTKGPGKKWILVEQSYILAGNMLKSRICSMNNVQAWL